MVKKKELWLAERRKHITGTDVAAILGLSPWASPIDVWLDKTGRAEPKQENEAMRRGLQMQEVILDIYEETTGNEIGHCDPFELVVSKDNSLLAASLDAVVVDGGYPVDAKNVRYKRDGWGDAGTDVVPDPILLQMVLQMSATDTNQGDVAALFGGQEFIPYTIQQDQALLHQIIEQSERWWRDYVVADRMPPVDGSQSCREWINRTRQLNEAMLPSDCELDAAACELSHVRGIIEHWQGRETGLENRIKQAVGESVGITGPNWKVTWKGAKDSQTTEWKAIAYALKADQELIDKYTITKPGSRRFLFKYEVESEEK